jgi:cyclophilin family peptidyl-prolyl cis-trans isomerase
MSKRKPGGGGFAAKKQRELEERMKQQQRRSLLIWAVIIAMSMGAIALLWPRLTATPVEPAAEGTISDGERPLATISPAMRANYYDAYPDMVIDTNKEYEAIIRTEKGDMRLHLFDDESPLAVNNFVFLSQQGFYDGLTFHRVLEDFMAQGGDPSGTGGAGPGYQFADEVDNGLTFDRRGLLAMANAGPATNGSQFFITFVPTPHLNGLHTIFGEVIEGDAVLDQIARVAPGQPGDVIERIDIVEK